MKRIMMLVAMMVVAACPAIVTAETDKMAVKLEQANSNQDKIAVLRELFEQGQPMTQGAFFKKLAGTESPRMSGAFVGVNTDDNGRQQDFLGEIGFRAYSSDANFGPLLGGNRINSITYTVELPSPFVARILNREIVNPDLKTSVIELAATSYAGHVQISIRKKGPFTVGKIIITGILVLDWVCSGHNEIMNTEGYFYFWK